MQERALPLVLRVNKEGTKNLEAEPKEFSPKPRFRCFCWGCGCRTDTACWWWRSLSKSIGQNWFVGMPCRMAEKFTEGYIVHRKGLLGGGKTHWKAWVGGAGPPQALKPPICWFGGPTKNKTAYRYQKEKSLSLCMVYSVPPTPSIDKASR